jgi:hypothetical protein
MSEEPDFPIPETNVLAVASHVGPTLLYLRIWTGLTLY